MKNFFGEYFSFTRRELNGIIVLLLLLVAMIIAPQFLHLFHADANADFSEFEKEIAVFEADLQQERKKQPAYQQDVDEGEEIPGSATLFTFDPNNLPAEEWKRLGLSSKQINTIKNYESRGGKFYRKEDLAKIYSISKEDYIRLEPYILIPQLKGDKAVSPRYVPQIIELNLADSSMLVKLPGIGSVFASRIIKFRSNLGGFYKVEQLKEVFGMDSARYVQMLPLLKVDPSKVRQININTAGIEEFKAHPYFRYKIGNAMINYRRQHGDYKNKEELKKLILIGEELFEKINPYITLGQ